MKLFEATGATTRIWFSLFAGESPDRVNTVAEFENNSVLGAGIDQMMAKRPLPTSKLMEGDDPAALDEGLSALVELT